MFGKHRVAGVSILVGALATAAVSGSSCAPNEVGLAASSSGSEDPAPTCTDGFRNGGETDTNCGGPCSPCPDGKACFVEGDCTSGVCAGGVCAKPSCADGAHNGGETDTDCGGSCATKCSVGWDCTVNADCFSNVCLSNYCYPNSNTSNCFDAIQNGTETAIDCGGGGCPGCGLGKACVVDSDCSRFDGLKCDPTLKTCQKR